ncbi:MAG: hypothetical protein M3373_03415 [Gemmatimonadota bacterium]|nr:hypothetical protein [Gemmatimonadota bacterium]
MTEPLVHAMRITLTWMESDFALLQEEASSAPFAFLGRDYYYEARFEELRQQGKGEQGLLLPWDRPEGQRFWTFYLDGTTPGSVKANTAWRALVPVRVKPPLIVRADWLLGKADVEGFFYPHATASVITFTIRAPKGAPLTLEKSIELAQDIRGNRKLTLVAEDTAEELVVDAVKDRVRDYLRRMRLGVGAAPGKVTTTPFSVVTFLSLENAAPTKALEAGNPVHRALQALVEWSSTWQVDELQPLAEHGLPRRKAAPSGDVVFAGPRGRVVWLPKFAGDPPPKRPKLACYHRNLVLAAMQVDALGALVTAADERLAQWDNLPAPLRECSRNAAGLLTRLYLAKTSIYQSASCRRQIDDAHLVDALKRVRARNNLPEIVFA